MFCNMPRLFQLGPVKKNHHHFLDQDCYCLCTSTSWAPWIRNSRRGFGGMTELHPPKHTWMFPKMEGKPPKWMVKIMENPIKMDDLGGKPPIFGKHPPGPTTHRRKQHRWPPGGIFLEDIGIQVIRQQDFFLLVISRIIFWNLRNVEDHFRMSGWKLVQYINWFIISYIVDLQPTYRADIIHLLPIVTKYHGHPSTAVSQTKLQRLVNPEIAGLLISASDNPWVSLNTAGD